MGQPAHSEEYHHNQIFIMAPESRTTQRSLRVNPPVDPTEQDELAGAQGGRSNTGNNKTPIPPEAPTPTLVPSLSEDLFTKFLKVFIETT